MQLVKLSECMNEVAYEETERNSTNPHKSDNISQIFP